MPVLATPQPPPPPAVPPPLLELGVRQATALGWQQMSTGRLVRLLAGDPTALPTPTDT
jgi:hypothetical protein